MFVFVKYAAKAVASVDVLMGETVRGDDRLGWRCEWPGVGDALVRSVVVVEGFVLA